MERRTPLLVVGVELDHEQAAQDLRPQHVLAAQLGLDVRGEQEDVGRGGDEGEQDALKQRDDDGVEDDPYRLVEVLFDHGPAVVLGAPGVSALAPVVVGEAELAHVLAGVLTIVWILRY